MTLEFEDFIERVKDNWIEGHYVRFWWDVLRDELKALELPERDEHDDKFSWDMTVGKLTDKPKPTKEKELDEILKEFCSEDGYIVFEWRRQLKKSLLNWAGITKKGE